MERLNKMYIGEMTHPTEPEHILSLLEEMGSELDHLRSHLSHLQSACEKRNAPSLA